MTEFQMKNAAEAAPGMGQAVESTSSDTPRTMLGFMYRGTYFPNFRRAAWDDLAQLFEWFNVSDNAEFVAACTNVDHAAYLLRRYTNDVDAREADNHQVVTHALAQMADSAPIQFREAFIQIEAQVAAGTLPLFAGLPQLPNDTLLALIYGVVYYPAYREHLLGLDESELPGATPEQRSLLVRLAAGLRDPSSPGLPRTLMDARDALSEEYRTVGWKICW